ncbi:hypothetical protein, partial [Escherichia coli]|uniref:hypothetical protein n=1 Tax=Escherichia coli TaxID=562 RepID=UPI00197D878F
PTKFEKPAQRAGFFASAAHEDENLRGQGGSTRRRPDKTRQRRIRQKAATNKTNTASPGIKFMRKK